MVLRNSRLLRLLFAVLAGCVVLACWLILDRGYLLLAQVAVAVSLYLLWRLRPRDHAGSSLCWRNGQWQWEEAGCSVALQLLPRRICLPWCLYVSWRVPDGGKQGGLWLLPDSAGTDELRHLRRRLRLQH